MSLGELATVLTIEERDIYLLPHRTALEYLVKMICQVFDGLALVINHLTFAICN